MSVVEEQDEEEWSESEYTDASSDEEFDFDSEPRLKYQRLGGDVPDILKRDSMVCMLAKENLIILASALGKIYVLDNLGKLIMKLDVHQGRINALCLDDGGDLLATAGDDGNVVITNIYTREKNKFSYQRAVLAVQLAPDYKTEAVFAMGGKNKQLVINEPYWFSNRNNVIHGGEGPVYAVAWKNTLIAWANDLGVKVFDYITKERITFIGRSGPPPGAYRCNLRWASNDTLLIGWANSVKIGVVMTRPKEARSTEMVRYIKIVGMFQTDFIIAGIAPFDEDLMLLAHLEPDADDPDTPQRPELRIVSRSNELIISESLPLAGYETCQANDYRLEYCKTAKSLEAAATESARIQRQSLDTDRSPTERRVSELDSKQVIIEAQQSSQNSIFYMLAPRDIVVARPCDTDDHITWLFGHGQYEQALILARAHLDELKTHNLLDIGEKALKYWFDHEEYTKAAENCPELLDHKKELWEAWIVVFWKAGQLAVIVKHVPVQNPTLSHTMYEMMLNHFLRHDETQFCALIQEWPCTIYNPSNVISAVLGKLAEAENPSLGNDAMHKALGDLYIKTREYTKALHSYLRLGQPDFVFDLVNRLDLTDAIKDKVKPLMFLDETQAVTLFVAKREIVPAGLVISQLTDEPRLQYLYLDALFVKDSLAGESYHNLMVSLYAKYDSEKLLPFLLDRNSMYALKSALEICEENKFYREQVHILRRMGGPATTKALRLIIEELHDVKQALAFMEEDKDNELWEEVIKYSLTDSEFLMQLLDHVGAAQHVDILMLISRIPDNMEITGLKQKISTILSDCTLQLSVLKGSNNILKRDCLSLQQRLVRRSRRAVLVDLKTCCNVCNLEIVQGGRQPVISFFCKHHYHQSCYDTKATGHARKDGRNACLVCINNQRSGWRLGGSKRGH